MQSSRETTALLLGAGPLAIVLFLPFAIAAARETPNYGHISSTFSDSAAQGAPHPEIIGTGLILVGVCLILFSIGLSRVMPGQRRIAQLCLLTTAAGLWGTATFHDHNRSPLVERNAEGYLHNTFATVTIFAILATIAVTGFASRRDHRWQHLGRPAIITFITAALAALGFNFGPDSHDGLAERILAFVALFWITTLAVTALCALYDLPFARKELAALSPASPQLTSGDD